MTKREKIIFKDLIAALDSMNELAYYAIDFKKQGPKAWKTHQKTLKALIKAKEIL